jgi:hypothetical protein
MARGRTEAAVYYISLTPHARMHFFHACAESDELSSSADRAVAAAGATRIITQMIETCRLSLRDAPAMQHRAEGRATECD